MSELSQKQTGILKQKPFDKVTLPPVSDPWGGLEEVYGLIGLRIGKVQMIGLIQGQCQV